MTNSLYPNSSVMTSKYSSTISSDTLYNTCNKYIYISKYN